MGHREQVLYLSAALTVLLVAMLGSFSVFLVFCYFALCLLLIFRYPFYLPALLKVFVSRRLCYPPLLGG